MFTLYSSVKPIPPNGQKTAFSQPPHENQVNESTRTGGFPRTSPPRLPLCGPPNFSQPCVPAFLHPRACCFSCLFLQVPRPWDPQAAVCVPLAAGHVCGGSVVREGLSPNISGGAVSVPHSAASLGLAQRWAQGMCSVSVQRVREPSSCGPLTRCTHSLAHSSG